MTEQRKDFPEFYVTSPQPCPYLPGRLERKLFTHLNRDKSPAVVDRLLRGGFRRSLNIAYVPYCEGCNACTSVRVPVDRFEPTRNQRRTLRANASLVATRLPNRPTSEQYDLFRDYIDVRHGDGGMADMSVLDYHLMVSDTSVDTGLTEYRERASEQPGRGANRRGRLVACALTDTLSDGISLVYSFFDPALASRSLGRYIILEHIAFARSKGLPYVYLGYWIAGSRKMTYKAEYLPQEHLTQQGWQEVTPRVEEASAR
ncbi:MAG: arginyltransferase [Rhizobiales bacterium]|nr:arginyltransferase [Hyphomicrobiales bacterium]